MTHAESQAKWNAKNREKLNAYRRKYRADHPEQVRAWAQASYWKHRDKNRARAKAWALANPVSRRIRRRKQNLSQYGLSADSYAQMLSAQLGKCAICGAHGRDAPLCVDHDHGSGVVRGLLCRHCNLMLGHAGDSGETLLRAIKYLRRSRQAKEELS
jgi:hypothetical protein